ncbi:hypothetical protein DSCW_17950 [Desulfosarcina widdelii]|uniref:Uncharacterized protein n=1 Tax=Desulfosarcina widdelii TaxID=947919 RepID=A0A5K7Z0F7_9BACT|nr:hypothetical protein [Desulfosarcina widdelii]BBO74378.1 hypothetical protein DSCW_17950 [Desulfosarcina widdelii]
MIEAGFLLAGVILGVAVTFFVARNNQRYINRALNSDKELKRRLNAAVKAAKLS